MSESPTAAFFRRLRERRVVPWTLAYIAGAWIAVEATQALSEMFGWPDWIAPTLTIALAFGVLSTLTIAWYHGASGWQRVTKQEAAIHGVIAVSLAVTLWLNPPAGESFAERVAELPATRVAVLYYKDHTESQSLRSLSSDLTEAVVHQLTQVPALEVLPLTAVEPFRGTGTPVDSIVDALAAGSVVEGSITRLGDEIVVTTQLFEAESRVHQGSWRHTRPDSARAAVITDVADSVANAIRTAIGERVREHRVRTTTDVPEAKAAYQRADAILANEARATWWEDPKRGVELLDEADRLLAEAERLDPEWIEPTLRRIHVAETKAQLMGGAGTMDRAILRTAIDHADRALELTSDSAALLERRGTLRLTLADYSDPEPANRLREEAERDLRQASRLDPDLPRAWWGLSQILADRGHWEGAYDYAKTAYSKDSFMELTADVLARLCLTAVNLERIDEARSWCRHGRRLQPDEDQAFAQYTLAVLASLPDPAPEDLDAAWAYVDTLAAAGMPDRRSTWRAYGQMLAAMTLASAGHADSADAVIRRARQALRRHADAEMQAAGAYFEAAARLRMDQPEAAYSAIREYIEVFGGRAEALRSDWWFRELWDDRRFIELYGGTPTESLGGA